ncbi:HNH endonuclease signature motif containing protein [Pseudomonas bharatica]|uniref:HNH endonuclease signature motif containing protein n=1 Tax=Pseudomonas bharatica TaxID=2692112 RepID=UPI001F04C7DA|nr:HNH endonuclease [Pseudomonas bharatica]
MVTRLTDDVGPAALLPALQSLGGHIEYLDSVSSNTQAKQSSLRSLYDELLLRLSPVVKTTDEDEIFAQQVADAIADSASDRAKRLDHANPVPQVRHQIVKTFRRNPDVVAEVLLRAKGVCERCRLPAPFQRPNGSLYLEVHHIRRLADGGTIL